MHTAWNQWGIQRNVWVNTVFSHVWGVYPYSRIVYGFNHCLAHSHTVWNPRGIYRNVSMNKVFTSVWGIPHQPSGLRLHTLSTHSHTTWNSLRILRNEWMNVLLTFVWGNAPTAKWSKALHTFFAYSHFLIWLQSCKKVITDTQCLKWSKDICCQNDTSL